MSKEVDRLKKRNGFSTLQRISADHDGVALSPVESAATSDVAASAA
jgi:hypothetical protein